MMTMMEMIMIMIDADYLLAIVGYSRSAAATCMQLAHNPRQLGTKANEGTQR